MYEKLIKTDKKYPAKLLAHLENSPDLDVLGNPDLLESKAIGFVGSRFESSYGRDVCKSFASLLINKNLSIVSGLAPGIDMTIHDCSLDTKLMCIGILGFGLNYLSGFENYPLVKRIVDSGGCVVSPFKADQKPTSRTFIERNKVISALSDALVVVEATLKSGTFYTVSSAVDFDVPVFAVPGSIFSKNSKGTNSLIKSGAYLLDDITELFAALKF